MNDHDDPQKFPGLNFHSLFPCAFAASDVKKAELVPPPRPPHLSPPGSVREEILTGSSSPAERGPAVTWRITGND